MLLKKYPKYNPNGIGCQTNIENYESENKSKRILEIHKTVNGKTAGGSNER